MVRKELREHIFKMLFQIEFNDPQEMPEQIEYYFSTLEDAADKDKEYIKRKYAAVLEKTEEIDELINANAKGWKTTRMNKVDLSILRLAVYEMKWDDEVPVGVAINEVSMSGMESISCTQERSFWTVRDFCMKDSRH